MPSRVTHFENYGDEPEKLAAFYRALLGWRTERAECVDYWRIAIDAPPKVTSGGGITRRPAFAHQGWMNFVEVESLDEVVAAAQRLGGTVIKQKTAVPRTAWHAVIADPAGNAFLIWLADPTAFPPQPD